MSDGIRELMGRAVVISGDEAPVVNLATAEGVAAFAHWLLYLKADGSVPFDVLARHFIDSQGWEVRDPQYRRRLRSLPEIAGRIESPKSAPQPQGDLAGVAGDPDAPQPDQEPVEITPAMQSPAGAVIISGGQDSPDIVTPGDHFVGDGPSRRL